MVSRVRRRTITIRIMWDDFMDKDEAIRLAKKIEDLLVREGYKYTKPKFFRNRKNSGGRIYISITNKK